MPDVATEPAPARAKVHDMMTTPDAAVEGLSIEQLNAWFGKHHVVADVSLVAPAHRVTALIGPSGCGKSTLLRCVNRMHEIVPGAQRDRDGISAPESVSDHVDLRERDHRRAPRQDRGESKAGRHRRERAA